MINREYEEYLKNSSWAYRSDGYETVELHAIYAKGKLLDSETEEEMKIRDGSFLTIITGEYSLLEKEELEKQTVKNKKEIARSGEEFTFGFFLKDEKDDIYFQCKLRIKKHLMMAWKGKKMGKLLPCSCEVFEIIKVQGEYGHPIENFLPIESYSLNSAYTLTSIKYRPDVASHTCNVFKVFVDKDGIPLDYRRKKLMSETG